MTTTLYTTNPDQYPYRVWRDNGTPALNHAHATLAEAVSYADTYTRSSGKVYTVTGPTEGAR